VRIWRYSSDEFGAPRVAVQAASDAPKVDLALAWPEVTGNTINARAATSTFDLIEAGPDAWDAARSCAESALDGAAVSETAAGFRWLCPFDRIASLRDFLAFESHVKLGAERRNGIVPPYWYDAPVYYKGNHRQLLGPGDDIPWPPYTDYLDFELEIAMVIGRRGTDVSARDAPGYIFGFTLFNDVSARDVQMREVSAWLGPAKGKDFANAFGPCIVTVDEIGVAPDLEMRCFVNDEEWGRGQSGDLHWSWDDMIATVSRGETIFPGDVYGSGTPGGCCGLDLDRRITPGDRVRLELGAPAGISITNVVGARQI